MPGRFRNKGQLASFCLQYMYHDFFYRPCNFHINILSSFEIIAKNLSVALEMSLSICIENCIIGMCVKIRLSVFALVKEQHGANSAVSFVLYLRRVVRK